MLSKKSTNLCNQTSNNPKLRSFYFPKTVQPSRTLHFFPLYSFATHYPHQIFHNSRAPLCASARLKRDTPIEKIVSVRSRSTIVLVPLPPTTHPPNIQPNPPRCSWKCILLLLLLVLLRECMALNDIDWCVCMYVSVYICMVEIQYCSRSDWFLLVEKIGYFDCLG